MSNDEHNNKTLSNNEYPSLDKSNSIDEYSLAMHKMAHEFGNILTLINSSLQIISSSHPEVQTYKYWNTTVTDVHYLIDLVSEISLFGNGDKLRPTDVNLVEIIESIILSYKSNSSYKNVSINLHINNEIPIILADKTKLRQVFINLIKNAYEALSIASNPKLIITLSSSNTHIDIDIKDNGCGISDEQIPNVFSPMISYKENGTGLGLPISKKIIEAHNGKITFDTVANEGTTFHISLPY